MIPTGANCKCSGYPTNTPPTSDTHTHMTQYSLRLEVTLLLNSPTGVTISTAESHRLSVLAQSTLTREVSAGAERFSAASTCREVALLVMSVREVSSESYRDHERRECWVNV